MNHHVVFTRFGEMDENLKILEEFKAIAFAEFAGDPKIYKLTERCFQLCIECIIDIAHYLIAQNHWEQPLNSKEAVLALGDHGVLPELFAKSIAGMVGFRNILVHGYIRIDRAVIYAHLKKLEDFRDFQNTFWNTSTSKYSPAHHQHHNQFRRNYYSANNVVICSSSLLRVLVPSWFKKVLHG